MASFEHQASTFITGRIGGWSNRHRRIVIGVWVLLLALAIVVLAGVGTDTEARAGGGAGESGKASELREERFGVVEAAPTELVIFSHPTLTVDDPEYRDTVLSLMEEVRALRATTRQVKGDTIVSSQTRVVASTITHYDIGISREGSPYVAQNETGGDVTFANLVLEGELFESTVGAVPAAIDEIDLVLDAVAAAQARSPDFSILVGGDASQGKQSDDAIQEDFSFALIVGLFVALVILLWALGTLVSAAIPIAVAFVGIFFTLGLLALISKAIALDGVFIQVVLLIGLAAGVDYALFLVTRFRSERESGAPSLDSVQVAGHTAGRNVFIAAMTTVLALAGLFFVGIPVFTGLGISAIVTILVAGIISVTLLPALMGDGLNRLRIPFIYRPRATRKNPYNRYVAKLVGVVVARPLIFAPVFIAILIVLALPLINLNTSLNGAKALNDEIEAKAAFIALEDNFTVGLVSPAQVIVDPGKNQNVFAPEVQASINRLIAGVEAENARAREAGEHVPFGEPIQTEINNAGDTEVVSIPINADPNEDIALDAVKLLRDKIIPAAFEGSSVRALVTGVSAGTSDFNDDLASKTPIVFAFVIVTSFIILVIMYRSLVIPLIGVVLNALSVAASYGILVLVFQEGYALEGILDFKATGIIESWLPLFVFSFLFGISMDYLTFAIGRFKELHDRGLSTEEAILEAIRGGFGTVFSAAMIMVGVAGVFAFTRNLALQQFGFALAVAVFLDGTIILAILVPAFLRLAGESNWYFPSWLNWIPGGGKPRAQEAAPVASQPSAGN